MITKDFGYAAPAMYCIEILGEINQAYSRYLNDMLIATTIRLGSKPISTLTGSLADQSALNGVLNALYDMHMTIISISVIDE